MRSIAALTAALAWIVLAAPAQADVQLAGLFGDDMVLQRDQKISIWGRADAGEAVRVTFDGTSASTTAAEDGTWRVTMGPFVVQAAQKLHVVGKNTLTLTGVCVGDVWICSGQSNMAWPVKRAANAAQEIEDALNPRLRLFTVPRRVAGSPQADLARPATWSVCNPETVGDFSAVAYAFGRQVRLDLGIPVGLIVTAWGGTPAESWTRAEVLGRNSVLQPIAKRWNEALAAFPVRKQAFDKALADWKDAAKQARAKGEKPPRRPRPPPGPTHPHRAAGLWNGMVAPLVPFGIRGVIWYQGESNASRAEQYATLFPEMIKDWRVAWQQGDFPFLFVQLANFRAVREQPGDSAWAELRDAQRRALAVPRTGMAVAIDIGEARDIHPKNKQEVGRRLALCARALAYPDEIRGKLDGPIVSAGPLYQAVRFERGRARLTFTHRGTGLAIRGDGPLQGFTIAGSDRVFRKAQAALEDGQVLVWHPDISEPKAVRYAWADNPIANLANAEDLPASPFRTDDWPGVTAGKR